MTDYITCIKFSSNYTDGEISVNSLNNRCAETSVEQLEWFYLKNMEFNDDMAENF